MVNGLLASTRQWHNQFDNLKLSSCIIISTIFLSIVLRTLSSLLTFWRIISPYLLGTRYCKISYSRFYWLSQCIFNGRRCLTELQYHYCHDKAVFSTLSLITVSIVSDLTLWETLSEMSFWSASVSAEHNHEENSHTQPNTQEDRHPKNWHSIHSHLNQLAMQLYFRY